MIEIREYFVKMVREGIASILACIVIED